MKNVLWIEDSPLSDWEIREAVRAAQSVLDQHGFTVEEANAAYLASLAGEPHNAAAARAWVHAELALPDDLPGCASLAMG